MSIRRHILDADEDQTKNIQVGIAWLDKLTPRGRVSLLATGAIGTVDGIISAVIGDPAVKALKAGEAAGLSSGGSLALMTVRRAPPPIWRGGAVLAAYGGSELLDLVDALHGVTDVLAIPWTNDDAQQWIATWNVPRLGETPRPARSQISNYVVENALKDLASSINIADGGIHPSDRAATVQLFQLLKKHGEGFDSDEVRAWLIARAGMDARGADGIRDIAAKINAGRSPRTRDTITHWRDGIIGEWRRKA